MTARCPRGHDSASEDYCDTCGAPLTTGVDQGVVAEPVVPGPFETAAADGRDPAGPDAPCPNCGSPTEGAAACPQCGYRTDAPDSLAVWEEQHWEVVARPDRQYFDLIDPEGMDFPETVTSRRIPLVGDHVRIGRRSVSRGISPEIDLSGTLEDVGVSHRHAVLMRQPNGSWAVVDEGSTNGTYLNLDDDPVPANHRVPLRDGDRVHVGAWTTLTIERVEVPEKAPPEVDVPSKNTRGIPRNRSAFEIGVLGPFELAVSGNDAAISAPKARAVLAVLALRIGTAVPAGDLEWALWGEDPPRTSDKALQGHISTLRRLLPEGAIETTASGYRLVGPKDAVDAHRFERRCLRGRELLAAGHPGSAAAEITRAMDLWRGEPLMDLADGPIGAVEVSRLREHRAIAEEHVFEARLQLADHEGVIPELTGAVDAEPLRQRRWAQLMLALYRSGRQPEALTTFERLRGLLGEDHGLEPSAELWELQRAIVLEEPWLRWSPPAPVPAGAPAVPARPSP
jgi:DNA-binding SARP family transcriptional activator